MIKYTNERIITVPFGLGNAPVSELKLVAGRYDLILFNNATKKGYVFTGLTDTGTEMYYDLNGFEPGDIPYGEYSYALIYNVLTGVEYTLKNSLLGTDITYNGITYHLEELTPEIGLFKYVNENVEEPEYRDTEKEFYYRKKSNN